MSMNIELNPKKKLHIVMFPWLAFGHIIPFLELSKRLATKGHHISFISTPRNLERLPKIPLHLIPSINLVSLPLPQLENLPLNAEATIDVPFHKIDFLKKAFDGLQEPFKKFLEETSYPIDCIIYDFSCYWLPQIVEKIGVKKVFFCILNAYSLSFLASSASNVKDNDNGDFRMINASGVSDVYRSETSIRGCHLIALRGCMELEAEYFPLIEQFFKKPVVPTGMLPITIEHVSTEDDTWQAISGWLDEHEKGSVIYVALGSEVAPSQDQISELALGLELSKLPFFWALRKPAGSSVELPAGFEERTHFQGRVWTSWVPQPKVLAHESTGCFLTHCGWGSIVEGLQFGRPLVMMPFVLDQGLNAKLMQEKKLGVEIPRVDEGLFTRSSIAKTLKELLESESGEIYKEEAKKMGQFVSHKYLDEQYVERFEELLYKP